MCARSGAASRPSSRSGKGSCDSTGYGDIAPRTAPGQFLARMLMILGYAILAVPTGIVSVELRRIETRRASVRKCRRCSRPSHAPDAAFCDACGAKL